MPYTVYVLLHVCSMYLVLQTTMPQCSLSVYFSSRVQPSPRAKHEDVIDTLLYFRFKDRIPFGRAEGIGRVPMQNLFFLAEQKALGVYPCRSYCLWQNWRRWVRAHAEFYYFWPNWRHWACTHADLIAFGRTGGVGRVPMQNFITFGLTGGIGRVPMQNLLLLAELEALGVCPCRAYCFWPD